jgi:two-component system response regulator AlgR
MDRSLLIVDDEAPARDRLERLVDELPGWSVAGCCATGREAIEQVGRLEPAVVLLDIRMPGISGIEVARHLTALEHPPAVVFTTAYDQYALEAFESRAVGYLVKPVRRERLAAALEQAARLSDGTLRQLGGGGDGPSGARQHLAVRVRDDLELISVADIFYFQAEQKYVTIRHAGGESLIEDSLKNLEDEFGDAFVRIHRSVLVAVAKIAALEKCDDGGHRLRLRQIDQSLQVSRRQLGELKARLAAGR